MPGTQSIDRFIEDRRARWARLAQHVERAQGRASRLSADDVLELGSLYRSATSDLSIVLRDFPLDPVARELNDLVAAAHALVYSEAPASGGGLWRFVSREVPATVRANWRFSLVAFLFVVVPLAFTFAAGVISPDLAASSMSQETRDYLLRRTPGTELPPAARPIAGPLIILNNVQVGVVAFGGGMTAGLLTAYVLIANGASLGTTFAILAAFGSATPLLTFTLAHGVLELSAIFLSGGAGLRLAWAILRPGDLSRGDALRLASARSLRVMLLVIVTLGVAGLIEAFVSPTTLAVAAKLAIGVATGSLLWAYVLLAGRQSARRLSSR